MKIKYLLVKIFPLLILLIVLLAFSQKKHRSKKIQDIQVQLDVPKDKALFGVESIQELIESNIKNNNRLDSISIYTIEKELNKNPFIHHSEVFLSADGELNCKIQEEKAIARIIDGEESYLLTNEGKSIPLSVSYSPTVILVSGKIKKQEYPKIVKLIDYINHDNLLKNHIIAIEKQRYNSFILKVEQFGFDISIGTLDDIDLKLSKLKLFYEQYLSKTNPNKYRRIILKYHNQIVAVKNNQDG